MHDVVAMSLRITKLEEENRALKEMLASDPRSDYRILGLRRRACDILRAIVAASPNFATRERLCIIFSANSRFPEREIDEMGSLAVEMSHLRKCLKSHGVEIISAKCTGYRITTADKARLAAIIERMK